MIPQAFVYPQKLYGKEFWLSIHDEWIKLIQQSRAEKAESDQLESLGLEIIDVHSRSSCLGLPKNTCSLSLRGGKRFTLNMEDSKRVAKKLSTHMLLTRSRQTADMELLDLDASQDYFLLNIEQLSETKDYLLFTIKKKEKE